MAFPQSALDDLLDCNHALQQELFAVAEHEGLGNLFAHRLYAARCEIAGQLRKEWQSSLDRRRAWALLQAKVARSALDLLEQRGIPNRVFKGAPLSVALYCEPGLRVSADIDLLVPASLASDAALMLVENGYVSAVEPRWFSDPAVIAQTREAPFSTLGGVLSIDLHWRLLDAWNGNEYLTETEVFAAPKYNINVDGINFPWFHAEQLWTIQLGNVVGSSWTGLKAFVDLAYASDAMSKSDWQLQADRAAARGFTPVLATALLVLQRLFERDVSHAQALIATPTMASRRISLFADKCIARLLSGASAQPNQSQIFSAGWAMRSSATDAGRLVRQLWTPSIEDYRVMPLGTSKYKRSMFAIRRRALKLISP